MCRSFLGSLLLLLPFTAAHAAAPPPVSPLHWAFRPPSRPAIPHATGCNPIDAFLRARLASGALTPAPAADRALLLRRVTFDLIGLPPTPEELADFLADTRSDAWERVVDRLLASPRHGERWAQHWLDVVRFAETNGYEGDAERPQFWRYRDLVVRSFNADKPWDRFVREQVAGDLLAQATSQTKGAPDTWGGETTAADLWISAGVHRCGPVHQVSGNIDPEETRQELLTEMVNGLGSAFLGLTIGCARCHDHKFDPLSQAEYYRLEAFFARAQPQAIELANPVEQAAHARDLTVFNARVLPLRNRIQALEAPYRKRLTAEKKARLEPAYRTALATNPAHRTPEQEKLAAHAQTLLKVTWDEVVGALDPADRARRGTLRQQIHDLNLHRPTPPARAWSLREGPGELKRHILRRGSLQFKGAVVTPGVPAVLGTSLPEQKPVDRLALAHWLSAPEHPLTARVIVNRLWQHHFGQGLVRTPNDFGTRGDRPSHPELLDWLARELIDSGWSLKHLHRLMVTSATYQQSSVASARDRSIDPDNRLLSHANRRRLEGETLRDALLAVTGALDQRLEGPSVRVPLEPEVEDLIFTEDEPGGLWLASPDPRDHHRRSLYLFAKRNVRLPLLEAFDQPDTFTSCPVRPVSTFAPQALILLNGPFMQEQSRLLARRLLREAPASSEQQVQRAFQLALARTPRATELRLTLAFLHEQADLVRDQLRARATVVLPDDLPSRVDPAHATALADFCLALLNRNAFVHVE